MKLSSIQLSIASALMVASLGMANAQSTNNVVRPPDSNANTAGGTTGSGAGHAMSGETGTPAEKSGSMKKGSSMSDCGDHAGGTKTEKSTATSSSGKDCTDSMKKGSSKMNKGTTSNSSGTTQENPAAPSK
jgi:hypothetical protein